MKKLSIACLFVLMLSSLGYGAFAYLKIEERVKTSNLIVTGKLKNVSESETENSRISKGTLVIEKVIYGNFVDLEGRKLKSGDEVKVAWQNSKMFACQFGFAENEEEIWFLAVDSEGVVESLGPSSSDSITELGEVRKHLKKQKREDGAARKIVLQNDGREINGPNSVKAEAPVRCMYGVETRQRKYSPQSAFLVMLASIALYWILYRSRFKIR